jgi:hypothetical protein
LGINNTALTFELQQVSALAAQGLRLSQLADLIGRSEDFVCAALQQCVQLGFLDPATFISVTENPFQSSAFTQSNAEFQSTTPIQSDAKSQSDGKIRSNSDTQLNARSQTSGGASNWFCNPEPDSIRCKSCFFYPSIKKTSILKK